MKAPSHGQTLDMVLSRGGSTRVAVTDPREEGWTVPHKADIDLRWWSGLPSTRGRTEPPGWRAAGAGQEETLAGRFTKPYSCRNATENLEAIDGEVPASPVPGPSMPCNELMRMLFANCTIGHISRTRPDTRKAPLRLGRPNNVLRDASEAVSEQRVSGVFV